MLYIIMPQAFKNVLPALGNEFIVLLKETSVAGYIALEDLTKGGDIIRSRTFSAFFPLITVALIYLIMVTIFTKLVGILERRRVTVTTNKGEILIRTRKSEKSIPGRPACLKRVNQEIRKGEVVVIVGSFRKWKIHVSPFFEPSGGSHRGPYLFRRYGPDRKKSGSGQTQTAYGNGVPAL